MFKKAMIYRLQAPIDKSQFDLDLAKMAFIPCAGHRGESFGWVAPVESEPELFHDVIGIILLRAMKQRKPVPSSALRDAIKARCQEYFKQWGEEPRRKQIQEFKEYAFTELTMQALPVSTTIEGYMTPDYIVINTTSKGDAEAFLNCLRKSLGSLQVTPFDTVDNPDRRFCDWIRDDCMPVGVALGFDFDFYDPATSATVKFRGIDADADMVRYLDAGMVCHKIALHHDGHTSFAIDKGLTISNISCNVMTEAPDGDEESDFDRMRADLLMSVSVLESILTVMTAGLGGERHIPEEKPVPDLELAP